MGKRGPAPNHSSNLSRERDVNRAGRPEITKGDRFPVTIPESDPEWHPIATRLWDSLATSGQSAFYQNSDWAMAYSLCEDLDYYKRSTGGRGRSGQMLQTIYSQLGSLLVTEGDRRRVQIELHEPDNSEEEAQVLTLADYTSGLGLVPDED